MTQHQDPAAPPATTERELKFEVPEAAWDALAAAMVEPGARIAPLHAVYYDSSDGRLGAARIALRVRREGDAWVQTLKAPGAHALERLEDNLPLGPVRPQAPAPRPDLSRHGAAVAHPVRAQLGLEADADWPALVPVFEVQVQRRILLLRQGGSVVEAALDDGELRAGGRSRPVRELELELVQGDASDLLALAQDWRARWGLALRVASKSARGQRLARGELFGRPVHARPPALPPQPRLHAFCAAVLDSCLDQVLGNADEIAAGSRLEAHVHQLRVGLRRLRTALRELPPLAAERRRLEPALVQVFRALGERRDRTHVLERIAPLVEAAGGRPLRLPPDFLDGADPGLLVRGDAFQGALLALLARAEALRGGAGGPLRRVLRKRLARLHRLVVRDGARFTRLDEARQHRVRKRLKRLRYLAEFAAPLHSPHAVEAYLDALKPAQDALGQYNDELVARALYQSLAATDPGALFGLGWLRSRQPEAAQACRRALRAVAQAPAFWNRKT